MRTYATLGCQVACLVLGLLAGPVNAQPKKAIKLYEKGESKMNKGLLVAATVHFTDAIALHPPYAEAYDLRGRSFQGMGRERAAIKDFRRAIELKAPSILPYVHLVVIYRENKAYQEALEVTEWMLADHPHEKIGAYHEQGTIYSAWGQKEKAIEAYQKCLDHCGTDQQDFAEEVKGKIQALR